MRKRSLLLIGTLAFAFISCKPIYETKYRFIMPKTLAERSCANICIRDKDNCINTCQKIASQVDITNNVISAFIDDTSKSNNTSKSNMKDCENRCNTSYRECYTNCGGQVIEEEVCISYCDDNEKSSKK